MDVIRLLPCEFIEYCAQSRGLDEYELNPGA